MTEPTPPTEDQDAETVSGGGTGGAIDAPNPVREAALRLELLSPDTREAILSKMPGPIAEKVREYLASLPDRPHGQFSTDIATRRQLIHQTANGVAARRTAEVDQQVSEMAGGAPAPMPMPGMDGAAQPAAPASTDPLDRLRELHPAAIARAMQGERAEAWAIVLDRLDVNARAALQLYLDASARTAIEDAKARQSELAASSPALLRTVEAAIARTVVPRAMREHHQLLSTTPLAWTGMPA